MFFEKCGRNVGTEMLLVVYSISIQYTGMSF